MPHHAHPGYTWEIGDSSDKTGSGGDQLPAENTLLKIHFFLSLSLRITFWLQEVQWSKHQTRTVWYYLPLCESSLKVV